MSAEHCNPLEYKQRMSDHTSFLLNAYLSSVKEIEAGAETLLRKDLYNLLNDTFAQMEKLRQQLECTTFRKATEMLNNCYYVLFEAARQYHKRVAQDGPSAYWDPRIFDQFDGVVNLAHSILQEQYLSYGLTVKKGID